MRFEDSAGSTSSQLDFVPRERRNQHSRLVMSFALIAIAVMLVGVVPMFHNHIGFTLALVVVIAILGLRVVSMYQKNLDLVMTTEFQNMLYTQGLALGCTFCVFIRRDGTVLHATDGMYQLLGENISELHMLDTIFERGGVHAVDRERVLEAIYATSRESLIIQIPDAAEKLKKYVLSVEPLARPRGHAMVRVREFRESRLDTSPTLKAVPQTEEALNETPVGHYVTDAYGQFTYVNPAFARILGYTPQEFMTSQLSLAAILSMLGERSINSEYTLDDFAGNATLLTRSGVGTSCLLVQHVLRDEKSKIIRASGTVVSPTMLTMGEF